VAVRKVVVPAPNRQLSCYGTHIFISTLLYFFPFMSLQISLITWYKASVAVRLFTVGNPGWCFVQINLKLLRSSKHNTRKKRSHFQVLITYTNTVLTWLFCISFKACEYVRDNLSSIFLQTFQEYLRSLTQHAPTRCYTFLAFHLINRGATSLFLLLLKHRIFAVWWFEFAILLQYVDSLYSTFVYSYI